MHFQSFLLRMSNLGTSAIRELLLPPFLTWRCCFLSLWIFFYRDNCSVKAVGPSCHSNLIPVLRSTSALSGLKLSLFLSSAFYLKIDIKTKLSREPTEQNAFLALGMLSKNEAYCKPRLTLAPQHGIMIMQAMLHLKNLI